MEGRVCKLQQHMFTVQARGHAVVPQLHCSAAVMLQCNGHAAVPWLCCSAMVTGMGCAAVAVPEDVLLATCPVPAQARGSHRVGEGGVFI